MTQPTEFTALTDPTNVDMVLVDDDVEVTTGMTQAEAYEFLTHGLWTPPVDLVTVEETGPSLADVEALLTGQPTLAESLTPLVAGSEPHSGVMVALRPTYVDAQRLALPDGEPWEELHVTLCYLGDAELWPEEARRVLTQEVDVCLAGYPVVHAQVFAVDVFNPLGEKPCLVLGVGGDGGDQIDAMYREVEATTTAVAETYAIAKPPPKRPYVAHMTLKYLTPADLEDLDVGDVYEKTGSVTFDAVRVAFAGEVADLPLE